MNENEQWNKIQIKKKYKKWVSVQQKKKGKKPLLNFSRYDNIKIVTIIILKKFWEEFEHK